MSASLLDDGGSIAGLVGVAVMETMGIIENVGAGADAGHVASISNDRDIADTYAFALALLRANLVSAVARRPSMPSAL